MNARREHYGEFYGLRPIDDRAPVAVVVGNCQAESVRVMLAAEDLVTVQLPPVFELEQSDLPHLERLLARTSLLVCQPIRDDYHDLPLGTAQLAARLGAGASVVRMPVVRFAGLYPFSVIVRPPGDLGAVPPIVAYHDLRTLHRAHQMSGGGAGDYRNVPAPTVAQVRQIASDSIGELRAREQHHDTIVVSDLFERPTFELMRTMNHPGNSLWAAAASRIRKRAGLAALEIDPGRELLDSVHAPRERIVIEAFDLDADPEPDWIINGARVTADEIERAHLAWYADRPTVVDAGLARHRRALEALELAS